MKKKISLIAMLALIFAVSNVFAYGELKKEEGKKKDWEEKFFHKAHFLCENKTELGLSEKQYKDIKALKIATKKELIMTNAEIEVIALDIKALMWEEPMDVKAIDKLIDKKYELKKEKAKTLVRAFAGIQETLSDKQKEKCEEMKETKEKKACKKGQKGQESRKPYKKAEKKIKL